MMEELKKHGIRLKNHSIGNQKTVCPKCSHTRSNKQDPCLSVTINTDGTLWKCHHCDFKGGAGAFSKERKTYQKPVYQPKDIRPQTLVEWFDKRGISTETLKRNHIGNGDKGIEFPYVLNGEVVNVKYRTKDKRFSQEKDAMPTFFKIDDVAGSDTVIICEGEIDALSFEEAGYPHAISVPNGAPADGQKADGKLECFQTCFDKLKNVKEFILATDADNPGVNLREAIAARVGKERCRMVYYPEGCKDANEVLLKHGTVGLKKLVELSKPYPLPGVEDAVSFEDRILAIHRGDIAQTFSTGWENVDKFMRIRLGELSVVTGVPGSGKSEFIDALMVNLAELYGWRFGLASFENPPEEHLIKIMEKHLKKPFRLGKNERISAESATESLRGWISEHFCITRKEDESATIDTILGYATTAVMRYGIKGLVIDPYNEIDHKRPANITETEYVSQMLAKVKRFARNHNVHVWFIAHPAKPSKDASGAVPSLYDIYGSANWVNKAEIGLVVHREDDDTALVEIHIRKVRFKACGERGKTSLVYNRITGCYSEFSE